MSARSGNAYGLGATLGLASFFSSLGDNGAGADLQNAVSSVAFARDHVAGLNQAGIPASPAPLEGASRPLRATYLVISSPRQSTTRSSVRENVYANDLGRYGVLGPIYNLGMAIAIGEGQLSVGSQPSINIAIGCLAQARTLAAQLQREFPFLNPVALDTDQL